ncbi:chitobiosyldiphosphodolichol beta-mannosyltransferase [Nannizzia gypsea CBS 118893]|uniref:Chitobiosyldiphosphodolichol beta-mannosyltransferase n=1 Tax=Arthroderma gypseum (strain ATCC MYA-4604 / CBS 118893) TaxID=535722 RepID=E4US36_ARTGP|nr:chitobiosyldiphosphodolichol beta-mannosyltransferase [Nannizzia gypsea CBS 118893]EFR00454.1 chitobiosyldiphosphodolichol beta-mannosyltransferase [Nannizzia gypsea CBS 118893]
MVLILVFSIIAIGVSSLALFRLVPTRLARKSLEPHHVVSVQIVVLGDIGHSPRMQCHALSIARHGGRVSLIGYHNSTPNQELLDHPLISIVALPSPPALLQTKKKALFPIAAIFKVLQQTWHLWVALGYRAEPAHWILVQNPPATPTLVFAILACYLRNSCLIIDWHNFGYSILALKLGSAHPMVRLMAWYEHVFSRYATAHFCVSNAMARILREQWKIKNPLMVLYDRPSSVFSPILDQRQRLAVLSSIPETSQDAMEIIQGRCRLLISSTSWTPDEDFSLLLDALCQYSASAEFAVPALASLLVIITGKGPLKDMYLSQIDKLKADGKLFSVSIKTAWLAFEDYARLLACGTLGVCLHTSSSGVDLPMKVVDMFGAGLPVVGWDQYEAWSELVTEGASGLGFDSADSLSRLLKNLLGHDESALKTLREGAIRESKNRWDQTWDPVAGAFLGLIS